MKKDELRENNKTIRENKKVLKTEKIIFQYV